MNDMSGTYSDLSGQGSVVAARMAVEDFGAAAKGMKVEIIGADHQNKPDVGSNVARTWLDVDKVDVIVDVPTSSVALAVSEIVRDKNKVFLVSGAAASDLTGPQCTPNTVHWTYDTWALANGTGQAIVKTGGDTWFFLTANYAFGLALERDTAAVVVKNGGKVLGQVRHPFPGTDFSSFLLQAQASKAKIIGLANAGGAKWQEMPTDDRLFGKGTVRADGRKIHPMYLFEVKKPAESKAPWDYYKLRATIPENVAFRPLNEGGCPLVKS